MKENRKKAILFIAIVLSGIGVSYASTGFVCRYVFRETFNRHLFYTFLVFGSIVLMMVFLWKNATQKPAILFAMVAIALGTFSIGITPDRVGVSWDDEIHYAGTLEISNFLNGIMYEADEKNIGDYGDNIHARVGYDRESYNEYMKEIEMSFESKACSLHQFSNYGIWSIAYIPSAIGIILGRGLGLSYAGVFNLGRLCNLLLYVLLISCAIKRVKYGKVLIAAIGLIPTTIFMAASYSYDPWITGFTILGFAYFFAELQDETTLKNKNILVMIGAITVGCIPKAIYFPFLFPLLFMPKAKFKSPKQRKIYYLTIIGAGLFLIATFLLPMLISGAGAGDSRGGFDVNATEQIKFILKKPLVYARILFKFQLDYMSLGSAGSTLQLFAYVGNGYFYGIVSLILTVLAFLDRGENEKNYIVVKSAGLLACTIAIILATTALYISFTPVASDTVAGMQGRYLIPTIYPALYSLGIGGTTHKINKNTFVCIPMLIVAITFILDMSRLCVIHY